MTSFVYQVILTYFFIGADRPFLKYLYKHVRAGIADKWFDIGLRLLGDDHVVQMIYANHHDDAMKCTADMLKSWLQRKPDATWNQLIQTLRKPYVDLGDLAVDIEKKLLESMVAVN